MAIKSIKPVEQTEEPSYEIEVFDNIPVPEAQPGARKSKYPWDIAKGQSFFVPGDDKKLKLMYTLAYSKSKAPRTTKYTVRKYNNNGVDGVMVWRTA